MLGAGGVGKTTLAAGYALALARDGRRVGLLGIDPARRLAGALGLNLPDQQVAVSRHPNLHAAVFSPAQALRRWALEACPDQDTRNRLQRNPFFLALADRLAGTSDVLAAIRMVEWEQGDPELTDLVIDTAPGLNAMEFLSHPQQLTAFLEGKLVVWLRRLADTHAGALGQKTARRVLTGLARLGGAHMLMDLAEFLLLVEGVLTRMLARLERARTWLADPGTQLVFVTAVRDDAAATTQQLVHALSGVGLRPTAVLLNRTLPHALMAELDAVDVPIGARPLVAYTRALLQMQERVVTALAGVAPVVGQVPDSAGLDSEGRLDALASLGAHIEGELRYTISRQ